MLACDSFNYGEFILYFKMPATLEWFWATFHIDFRGRTVVEVDEPLDGEDRKIRTGEALSISEAYSEQYKSFLSARKQLSEVKDVIYDLFMLAAAVSPPAKFEWLRNVFDVE